MPSREKQGFSYARGFLEPVAPIPLPLGALLTIASFPRNAIIIAIVIIIIIAIVIIATVIIAIVIITTVIIAIVIIATVIIATVIIAD